MLIKMLFRRYGFAFPDEDESQLEKNELLMCWGSQEDDKPFSVHLSDESFETYELDPPSYTMDTTKKELKQMYYDMVSVRCVPLHTHTILKHQLNI